MLAGKNQQDIKKNNRELVFKLICMGQSLSRIDISRLTGLTKMTVTNITNQLISEGLVKEGQQSEGDGNVGRKPIILLPCDDSVYAVGIYISRDAVIASLLNLSAKIIKKQEYKLSRQENEQSLLDKVLDGFEKVSAGIPKAKFVGIGVASIGPLDINRGIILNPPDFYKIRNVPIQEYLQDKTGLEVVLNNDNKASAITEKLYGKGRGLQNFIYVGITHGIGSGIFVDGKLFGGEMGHSGEIGHATIDFNGPECTCGNKGCLEVYTSIPSILNRAKKEMVKYDSVLNNLGKFSFSDISKYAKIDLLCGKIIKDVVRHLGVGLVNAVNTLDLSTVILGHEAAFGGEYFAGLLEKEINKHIFFKDEYVRVEIAEMKDQCPVIGSGVLALKKLFGEDI